MKKVKLLHLTLSDKSNLLQEKDLTKSVATILVDEGICMKTANTGDDVGIQMSGSGVRRASTLNARIEVNGANRAKRTRELV